MTDIEILIAYTDGSAYKNGMANACAGAGVWFGKEDKHNVYVWLPGSDQTNNAVEIQVVLEWVFKALQNESIMTITDSKYVIDGLCFHLKRWENSGWVGVANSNLWKATVATLKQWRNPIYFKWVKGHDGNAGNKGADKLAEQDAKLNVGEAIPVNIEIDWEFNVNQAKLLTLTQSQAYHLLMSLKTVLEWPSVT
ncbi:ribonuclease H-like domain-containing protein [Armillaria luteobubalina]|uniref:ribonuclease H n=1 Tax=Armillaria luteobubalina TaxID=153913 RepID=A0AA39QBS1_9AGAR|nr:ribonuclease H-like domain-containing protein [Armillaria luteobubalina]